jgi:hypothetical protein
MMRCAFENARRDELVTHDETWRIASDGLPQIDQILARIAFAAPQGWVEKATS